MRAVLLAPTVGADFDFYDVFTDITRAAATRLSVELEVIDCEKSAECLVDRGRALANRAPRPDCVLLPDYMGVAREILPLLDDAGVDAFVVAEGITGAARAKLGEPRQKHRHWLGEIVPGDVEAGYLLARSLTRLARERRRLGKDGRVHVGILSGDQSPAGLARFRGWARLKGEETDVEQASFQYAGWERGPARSATALMLRSHPEIGAIWAASDAMALGAADALRDAGLVPGRDVVLGGIDLGREALAGLATGQLAVSIGGHFLDGARAVILLHDRFHGHDFEPWSRPSPLVTATLDNAARYQRFVEGYAWREVNFARFSRVRYPETGSGDFTLESLLG